jgi:hypothetical protein
MKLTTTLRARGSTEAGTAAATMTWGPGVGLLLLVLSRKHTTMPKSIEKLGKARDLPKISFDTCTPLIDGINATTFWRTTPKRTINTFWRFQYRINVCKSMNTWSKLCSDLLPKARPVSAWIRPDGFPRFACPCDFTIMR